MAKLAKNGFVPVVKVEQARQASATEQKQLNNSLEYFDLLISFSSWKCQHSQKMFWQLGYFENGHCKICLNQEQFLGINHVKR